MKDMRGHALGDAVTEGEGWFLESEMVAQFTPATVHFTAVGLWSEVGRSRLPQGAVLTPRKQRKMNAKRCQLRIFQIGFGKRSDGSRLVYDPYW